MKKPHNFISFAVTYKTLTEVLEDHRLASLGDTFINFVYSLAMSQKKRRPVGVKVKGNILAEALRRSGLREHVPSRMSRHGLADAVEALLIYSWLTNCITLEESVKAIAGSDDSVEGLSQLLVKVKNRTKFS